MMYAARQHTAANRALHQRSSMKADPCHEGDVLKTKLLLAAGITFSLSAFAQTNSHNSDCRTGEHDTDVPSDRD